MKKIARKELLAILAATGVSSSAALAANLDSNNETNSLGKIEHSGLGYLADESACGKGSCGKDEKGAEAAKEKHGKAKKEKKKEGAKKEKKQESKEEKPEGKSD